MSPSSGVPQPQAETCSVTAFLLHQKCFLKRFFSVAQHRWVSMPHLLTCSLSCAFSAKEAASMGSWKTRKNASLVGNPQSASAQSHGQRGFALQPKQIRSFGPLFGYMMRPKQAPHQVGLSSLGHTLIIHTLAVSDRSRVV